MTKDHHHFSNQYQPIFPPARLMRTAWSVRPPAAAGHRLLPALWHSAVCVWERCGVEATGWARRWVWCVALVCRRVWELFHKDHREYLSLTQLTHTRTHSKTHTIWTVYRNAQCSHSHVRMHAHTHTHTACMFWWCLAVWLWAASFHGECSIWVLVTSSCEWSPLLVREYAQLGRAICPSIGALYVILPLLFLR